MNLNRKKNILSLAVIMLFSLSLAACGQGNKSTNTTNSLTSEENENNHQTDKNKIEETYQYIIKEKDTLSTRIATPKDYKRVVYADNGLADFLRNYKLKPYGSNVLLYNESTKNNQSAHVSVFELPIENYDLQQCADSIMRVYAEYFWSTGQFDRIAFHFTNGFLADYSKWREGYRINVNGNRVSWNLSQSYDDSYESFVKYLKVVFSYAGTLSMESESNTINLSDIQVGDIFLKGGSPGHVVMVIDVCENSQGKKAILLGQGYMPAQEFHVLKNNSHPDNPWYYEDEISYPFRTPEYTFPENSLKRLAY